MGRRVDVGEGRSLGEELLGPVLAEVGDAGGERGGDPVRGDGLGGGDEGDGVGVPPGAAGRGGDAGPDVGDGVGDAHRSRTATTAWRPVRPSRR